MKRRILIVEDDEPLARVLRDILTFDGFETQSVATAHLAIDMATEFAPDLIILDIMLPDGSGFELCGLLRQAGRTPVIMLTARSQKADKLRGLTLGADDYITKPFDLEELLARVHAVLRRSRPAIEFLQLGSVMIDFRMLRATQDGLSVQLSHREFELLRYLAERQGRVVFRDELLNQLWSYADKPITRSVDHAISRLRKKIEPDPHKPRYIHTVHGDGYSLTPEGLNQSTLAET